MLIFFVRHGLTDWNIQRRFQGTCDIPLNDAGIAQAQTAAARCGQLGFERIYHSTLLRAAQTAQVIAGALPSSLTARCSRHCSPPSPAFRFPAMPATM